MKHVYSDTFFDYIDQSARASAEVLINHLYPLLSPKSVIDLGSGRGVWLDEWQQRGVTDVLGVDGDYVDRSQLAIASNAFLAADLTAPVTTERRFDLAQSLEVGEHLPHSASETLIDSLTAASDRVLFSAAVKGQGGEFHINEQPLAFWQKLFEARGYHAYDCARPALRQERSVAPWYRYNTILYVNEAGLAGLPDDVTRYRVVSDQIVEDGGDALWKLRRLLVSKLGRNTVTRIAKLRAAVLATYARFRKATSGSST